MKTIEELAEENKKLCLELRILRFKESQEQRFIWWVWNVFARNVDDLTHAIMGATTYDTEGEAKEGKYGLPIKCFELMRKVEENTMHVVDGTYVDVEVSTENKTSPDNNKCVWVEVSDPDIDVWETTCGETFHFEDGTPKDNFMKFCCYCGKELIEERYD